MRVRRGPRTGSRCGGLLPPLRAIAERPPQAVVRDAPAFGGGRSVHVSCSARSSCRRSSGTRLDAVGTELVRRRLCRSPPTPFAVLNGSCREGRSRVARSARGGPTVAACRVLALSPPPPVRRHVHRALARYRRGRHARNLGNLCSAAAAPAGRGERIHRSACCRSRRLLLQESGVLESGDVGKPADAW